MKRFRVPSPCPRCQSNETGVFCNEVVSVKTEMKIRDEYAHRGLHVSFVSPDEIRELSRTQANAFCSACGLRYRAEMKKVLVEKDGVREFLESRGLSICKTEWRRQGPLKRLMSKMNRKRNAKQ